MEQMSSTTFKSDQLKEDASGILLKTIPQCFKETVSKFGKRDALFFKKDNKWEKISWEEYYSNSIRIANSFISLGLKPGEAVSIMGFNSPEWFISNMATIMAGGISVGIYTTNSEEICKHIIEDSNSTIIILENMEYLNKLSNLIKNINYKCIIIYGEKIEGNRPFEKLYDWEELINMSQSFDTNIVEKVIDNLKPNSCSTLIYTSGTTGNPKGVMLSHDNIIWTTSNILKTTGINEKQSEKIVSYLPLSHIAAQMLDLYMPLVNGGQTWFADSLALKSTLINTLKEAQPTIFLGVPRVWEKIMENMKASGNNMSGLKKTLSSKAKKIGIKTYYDKEKGNSKEPFSFKLCNKLVFKKIKFALGLNNCKLFLSGAAPISKNILEYFASLAIIINDIYGMSECSGPMTISYNGCFKMSSCGKPLPYTNLKLDNLTNEICTYGRHVMMGYLNQDQKTKEVIDQEGWLHSGDIGKIDADGFVFITGRLKELLITSSGENIPPVLIENNIKAEMPFISNCMLIGDKQKYLTVILTLKSISDENSNSTIISDLYKSIGINNQTITDLINNPLMLGYIQQGINNVNKKSISNAQKIQKFKILPNDFSIQSGELGPTLKLKRMVVYEKYKDIINSMYID